MQRIIAETIVQLQNKISHYLGLLRLDFESGEAKVKDMRNADDSFHNNKDDGKTHCFSVNEEARHFQIGSA